jgi:hypothetical protein
MTTPRSYENFPSWIIILSNLFSFLVYASGMYILSGFGILWSLLFLVYFLIMEFRLLRKSCWDCYYYGKRCAFGKGIICSWFFKKGDPQRFRQKKASWKDIIPDFLVVLVPLGGGMVLLVRDFNWLLLAIMVLMVVLYFGGNGFIRGNYACRYCQQKELGCPADQLFSRDRDQNQDA